MTLEQTSQIFSQEATILEDKFHAIHLNASLRYEREAQARGEHLAYFDGVLVTKRYSTIPVEMKNKDMDHILRWYRREGSECAPILYYTSSSLPSPNFECRLLARGVSTNWKAKWMWRDLDGPEVKSSVEDAGIEAYVSSTLGLNEGDGDDRVNAHCCEMFPGQFFRLVAMKRGVKLGSCVLNAITGTSTAGLFDMFVEPDKRNQGVGTALTLKALEIARETGCKSVYLNSTPDGAPLYHKVGFKVLLDGKTWHLKANFASLPSHREEVIELLQAIALADIPLMEQLWPQLTTEERKGPAVDGMTGLQIAVYFKQPASAQWLIDQGTEPDILSLWDLGMKTHAQRLLEQRPEAMNVLGREQQATPLHIAVERDDLELASLLVEAGCDCTVQDKSFGATALGWAAFLDRPRMRQLLEPKRGRVAA